MPKNCDGKLPLANGFSVAADVVEEALGLRNAAQSGREGRTKPDDARNQYALRQVRYLGALTRGGAEIWLERDGATCTANSQNYIQQRPPSEKDAREVIGVLHDLDGAAVFVLDEA